jgi:hypothetical protein
MATPLSRLLPPSPTAPPGPLQMNDTDLSRLAHEIARDIYPLEDILRQHNIDATYFRDHVMPHERFRVFYVEAHTLWNSASNAKERSALKSGVMFEEWLSEANRLFHDQTQPLSAKNELMKLIARVAGLDQPDKQQMGIAPGDRVVVNINLSAAGQREPIVIDKTAATVEVLPTQVG